MLLKNLCLEAFPNRVINIYANFGQFFLYLLRGIVVNKLYKISVNPKVNLPENANIFHTGRNVENYGKSLGFEHSSEDIHPLSFSFFMVLGIVLGNEFLP